MAKSKSLKQKTRVYSKAKKSKAGKQRRPASKKSFKKRNRAKKTLAGRRKTQKKSSFKKASSKKTKRKPAFAGASGYKIPYIKIQGLFDKMRLKKNDIIRSIEKQPISSKRQAYQKLAFILKNKKSFSLLLTRDKKDFLILYRVDSSKTKKRFRVFGAKKVRPPAKKSLTDKALKSGTAKVPPAKGKKQPPALNSKKPSKNKKQLVPEKYKPHVQKAYVVALNSFVYKQPNFDAPKLYSLAVGKEILISKKIFRPSHNFGSFYKVFLFHEAKVVGFISEAETAPEFLKRDGKLLPNPAYKLAKQQIKRDKFLDLDLIHKARQKFQSKERRKAAPDRASWKKRYIGLSVGFSSPSPFAPHQQDAYAGLRLSGYDLLISYLNMDLNLAADMNFQSFYFDILTAIPLVKANPYFLFAMGGVKLTADTKIKDPVDYGFSGALSLALPVHQKLLFRIDAKGEYSWRARASRYGCLASLQIAF